MSFQKNHELEFVYTYDFARDGGAVSTIPLTCSGANAMAAGLVITDFEIYVSALFTSGGSATCTLGNTVDDDGYSVDFFAAATLGAVLRPGNAAGALVWDDTNDVQKPYLIPSAAGAVPNLKIGTAALTAGAMKVIFKAYRP